jgi:hypothetical protein
VRSGSGSGSGVGSGLESGLGARVQARDRARLLIASGSGSGLGLGFGCVCANNCCGGLNLCQFCTRIRRVRVSAQMWVLLLEGRASPACLSLPSIIHIYNQPYNPPPKGITPLGRHNRAGWFKRKIKEIGGKKNYINKKRVPGLRGSALATARPCARRDCSPRSSQPFNGRNL